VNRNITHFGISWLEELARYSMVYMALLAAEAGLRDGTQISVTFVIDKVRGVARKIINVLVKLVVIGFSSVVFVNSFPILAAHFRSGQLSAGLRGSMFYPYLALTISFGIIVLVQTVSLIVILAMPLREKEAIAFADSFQVGATRYVRPSRYRRPSVSCVSGDRKVPLFLKNLTGTCWISCCMG
jgi:TRAP-type C4-dicarboxylate transport system permease small subunit